MNLSFKCGLNLIRKVLSNVEATVWVTLFWGGIYHAYRALKICHNWFSLLELILCVLLLVQLHPAGWLPDCEHDACSGCELGVHAAELPVWTTPEHAHSGTDPRVRWGGQTGGRWTQGGPRNCKSHPHPPTTPTPLYSTTVTASLSCDFCLHILHMITYCKYDFEIKLFFHWP